MRQGARKYAASLLFFVLAGCGPEPHDEEHFEEGTLGAWRAALNVGDAGGCSTGVVEGLSRQLIDEVNCLRPATLESFRGDGVRVGDVVWPYLQPAAKRGLRGAIGAHGGSIPITSA